MLNDNLFPNQKFALGQIVATPAFMQIANDYDARAILERHATGDWGNVGKENVKLNDASVNNGTRILSSYTINDETVWLITEASREVTTFLLPEEY